MATESQQDITLLSEHDLSSSLPSTSSSLLSLALPLPLDQHSSLGTRHSHAHAHTHTPTLANNNISTGNINILEPRFRNFNPTSTTTSTSASPSSSFFSNPRSRRNSTRRHKHNTNNAMLLSPQSDNDVLGKDILGDEMRHEHSDSEGAEIAIPSNGKTITPFLAKHIPNTYNPLNKQGNGNDDEARPSTSSNTKYCNRHRPDRKCRRQADGPSMDQLQSEISSLSHGDRSAISHVWSVFSAAPSKQRELILQGILSVACFNQLSFVSSQIRDLIKIDFIGLLPTEISLLILSKLDTISLCKSAQVSRRWRQLADDDEVWHGMCTQHLGSRCKKCGWGLPLLQKRQLREWKRQKLRRGEGQASVLNSEVPGQSQHDQASPNSGRKRTRSQDDDDDNASEASKRQRATPEADRVPLSKRPWKDVYKDRFKISSNWKHGRHNLNIIKHHTNGVTCLQEGSNVLGDHVLAAGSYDCSVTMHDIETGKLLKTFDGATMGIRCLQFDQRQLITGSLDGKVRLYDVESGELKKVLEGPTGGVISVHNDTHYLAAGSMDKNIYVWDTKTRRVTVLRGHSDFVNSVLIDPPSRTLFSASDDCTVALWDLDTKTVIKRFEGHVGPVQQVIAMPPEFEIDEQDLKEFREGYETDTDDHGAEGRDGREMMFARSPPPPLKLENSKLFFHDPERPNPTPNYIVTAGLDGTIRLWHVSSGLCLRTFFGHLEGIWSIKADNLRIVSTSEDGMVKLWCPHSGLCERTFIGHQGPVTCVSLTGERLITGGEDCEIRILSFGDDVGN